MSIDASLDFLTSTVYSFEVIYDCTAKTYMVRVFWANAADMSNITYQHESLEVALEKVVGQLRLQQARKE